MNPKRRSSTSRIVLCFVVLALIIALAVAAFVLANRFLKTEKTPVITQAPEIDLIQEELDEMTLDEKIAQLLIVESNGVTVTDEMRANLPTRPYGGYILLATDFGTHSATRSFIEQVQKLSKTTLIIATDQEGGNVQRLKNVKGSTPTNIPYMYNVGQTGNTTLARNIGAVMAKEMRTMGFNVDFAPVVDVYSNPNNKVIGYRSFSSDPQIVSKMAIAVAAGLEENGVVATYKHFPGHGDTSTDSHYSLPVINRTRAQLDQSDFVPFKNAIQQGAKVIMTGHIALPQITGDNMPATLSKKITTDILRNEFGFDGLIVTDGLNMGALTKYYSESDIYYRSIEAGADMLVLPLHPELAIQSIKEHISEARIDESVYRILKFKKEYLSNYEYLDPSYFGKPEHADSIKLN